MKTAVPDFASRAETPELMDSEDCDFATFRACLKDLALVNRLTLAYRPTLRFLGALKNEGRLPKDRPVEIVDVGSGYGDMLRKIARWSERRGIAVRLTGIDLNPWSTRAAQEITPPETPVVWRTTNIFEYAPPSEVDLVISSLFAHHLDDEALVRFLTWMESTATIGWFVNDLHRHRVSYHAFRTAARGMRLHPFVQHDGPVSIARSFVAADWHRALVAADVPLDEAGVARWTPFRLCVARRRRE